MELLVSINHVDKLGSPASKGNWFKLFYINTLVYGTKQKKWKGFYWVATLIQFVLASIGFGGIKSTHESIEHL